MCGICGIVSTRGLRPPIELGALSAMTDSMAHRGPDGRGEWVSPEGRVGLGHRRLSIIDLSPLGAQPMSNEDGSVWVTFNGEIYNYLTLRDELEAKGRQFRSKTDTEVLVHLYEEEGDKIVERLDGDFGLAIWDERRQRLLMARDPAGVKPLYYAWAGPYFLFASEIKAILEHPLFEGAVNPEGLYHYLTYLVVPAPETLVKGVFKLWAGQAMSLDMTGNLRSWQYWEPLPNQYPVDVTHLDEQLEDLFRQSVRKRLMSDVPVGVLFSGGVDSSLNALMFKELVEPEPVHTFNIWMRAPRYVDESDFASSVASLVGTEHHQRQLKEEDLLNSISDHDLMFHLDEPTADPVAVSLYYVTKLARESGVIVLQGGEGADEIFCGYDGYRNWLRREKRFWHPLSMLPRFVGTLGYQLARGLSAPIPMWNKYADVLRRKGLGQEFFMSEAVGYYEHEKSSILSPDFQSQMTGVDSFDMVRPLYDRLRSVAPDATFLQTMTYIELRLRLPELLLMRTDKPSMANSIEVRVPFLDRDLVEFALSIPESFKLRNGISKEPLKALATRRMRGEMNEAFPSHIGDSPHDLFYRPKSGFGAPIQDWFESGLGHDLQLMLCEDEADLSPFFDVPRLQQYLGEGMVTVNRAFQMWVIYGFVCWKRRFGL